MFTTGNKKIRKKRHLTAVPLVSDTNASVRTVGSRRVQFPPLQFVSEGVRTTTKPYNTRSYVGQNVQSDTADHTNTTCLPLNYDDKVADSDFGSAHLEEVQRETAEDLQLTKRQRMTNILAVDCGQCLNTADSMNGFSDEQTSVVPGHLKPLCFNVDGDSASCNQMRSGRVLDMSDEYLTVAEKSPNFVASQEHDLTVCAESLSAVHFDINTPVCDVERLDCSKGPQKVVHEIETETVNCVKNASGLADRHSIEPVHVLSFSRLDRSLDETDDRVERVICAAELNENMSELLDRDEETSVNARVDCRKSFCHDRSEFFSTLHALTPLENHCRNTVLVSDTPVSDYGLSYRQRALKAGNIRLRHRTHRS